MLESKKYTKLGNHTNYIGLQYYLMDDIKHSEYYNFNRNYLNMRRYLKDTSPHLLKELEEHDKNEYDKMEQLAKDKLNIVFKDLLIESKAIIKIYPELNSKGMKYLIPELENCDKGLYESKCIYAKSILKEFNKLKINRDNDAFFKCLLSTLRTIKFSFGIECLEKPNTTIELEKKFKKFEESRKYIDLYYYLVDIKFKFMYYYPEEHTGYKGDIDVVKISKKISEFIYI